MWCVREAVDIGLGRLGVFGNWVSETKILEGWKEGQGAMGEMTRGFQPMRALAAFDSVVNGSSSVMFTQQFVLQLLLQCPMVWRAWRGSGPERPKGEETVMQESGAR